MAFAALALAALALAAPARAETPNAFFAGGEPTFVVGTLGDARADRAVRGQVDLVRGLVCPRAAVVADVEVEVARGPAAWPARPVLYGNPTVNALLAEVADALPFRFEAGRLLVGERAFEGADVRLIAWLPESARHPEMLVYAGVGVPGVAEINAVWHGGESFLVADRFGRLVAGAWERDAAGRLVPRFGADARRERWRVVEAAAPGGGAAGGAGAEGADAAAGGEGAEGRSSGPAPQVPAAVRVSIHRLVLVPADPREQDEDAAIRRGVARAAGRLGLDAAARPGGDPLAIAVYVYPDARSKQILTGNGGDGHADPISGSLHVLRAHAAPGGALEAGVAHEATHLLAHAALGPAATPLLGEGLAVWVAGAYGRQPLEAWRGALPLDLPPLEALLGPAFRRLPEAVAYPAAGLLVGALVERVGLERFGRHLMPATAAGWAAACEAAGTTAAEVERLFRAALAGERAGAGAAPPPAPAPAPALPAIPYAREPRPGLLTGGMPSPEHLVLLAGRGFRTVIDLRTPAEGTADEAARAAALGLRYVAIPIGGAGDLTRANAEALARALAEAEGAPALVHCQSGNRVGALFAVMAREVEGATPDAALDLGRRAGLTKLEPAVRERLGLPTER